MKHVSALAQLVCLSLALMGCAPRLAPAPQHPGTHSHTVETPDGWQLGVLHLPPISRPIPGQSPVILAHGTSCNTGNFDVLERISLARALANLGYDVWMVETRGGPLGARPGAQNGELKRINRERYHAFTQRQYDWDFDTLVEIDVPAIVKRVLRWSGASQVHWIGHSMGGMVAWAAEARGTVSGFRSLVGIGSPGSFGHPTSTARLVSGGAWAVGLNHGLPVRNPMRHGGPVLRLVPQKLLGQLYNPENIDPDELRVVLSHVLEDSPPGLMYQYLRWIKGGEIVSRDGKYSYTRNLNQVRSPLLAIAGRADGVAPSWSVYPLYKFASSKDKQFRVFGVAEGDRIDYGHLDLVLGLNAPEEVYPAIETWLESH